VVFLCLKKGKRNNIMSKELQDTLNDLGKVVHEFKTTVDDRFEKMSKNEGIAELEAKLDKMNDSIDEFEGIKKTIELLETKANRIKNNDESQEVSEHKSAFNRFIRKGHDDGLAELQAKAISIGVDADGGFAVPESLDTTIGMIEREATPMRSICGQLTVSNEKYKKLVGIGGAASGWVGETAARPQTGTPTLAVIDPSFGEIYANPATTQTALDDTFFNVEAWLAGEVGREFAEQENLAFTSGNGTNKPSGILAATMALTADATRTFGQIQYRLSGTDSALGANDATAVNNLIDLTIDLRPGYRNNAGWVMPRSILRDIRKLRDTNGDLIWTAGLENGQSSSILGYGFTENEDMPEIADESNSLMFGDFRRGYVVYDVAGTRVLRDPFTNKPYVHFYTTKRVGGIVNDSLAIKVLRLGNGS
jgi:HK97 family phage major capsid protein